MEVDSPHPVPGRICSQRRKERVMAIDPAADREDLEPRVGLDEEAEERAAGEGMLAPEEDPETWGELESEKLDDGG
jgi:hypothetical protein